jgi:hypothetical protein
VEVGALRLPQKAKVLLDAALEFTHAQDNNSVTSAYVIGPATLCAALRARTRIDQCVVLKSASLLPHKW